MNLKANQMRENTITHKLQMDSIYSFQRHIYDASRKHYLLGRDRLLQELAPPHHGAVLELGCGTGRNLVIAAKNYETAHFYGLDISHEMLKTARRLIDKHELSKRISLKQADATNFSPKDLFGVETFDRIYISYSLSMIPDWQCTLQQAFTHLSENGSIHIVDFGQQTELPTLLKLILTKWLNLFHVTPRADLYDHVSKLAKKHNRNFKFQKQYRDYAHYCVIGPRRKLRDHTKKAA